MRPTSGRLTVGIAILALLGCAGQTIEFRRPTGQESMLVALKDDDPDARYAALVQLGKSKDTLTDDWAVKGLALLAETDSTSQVRALAVRTLGRVDDARAVPPAVKALTDPSPHVRAEAAWALQQFPRQTVRRADQAEPAKSALLKALAEDPALDVRINAAAALGRFTDRNVLMALITALKDHDFAVAYHAEQSLVRLTGKTFRGQAAKWLAWMKTTENPFEHAGEIPPELAKKKHTPWQRTRDRTYQFYLDWQGPAKR